MKPMSSTRSLLLTACVVILCGSSASVAHASCGDWLASHAEPEPGEPEWQGTGETPSAAPRVLGTETLVFEGRKTPCRGLFCRGGEPSPAERELNFLPSSDKVGTQTQWGSLIETRPSTEGTLFEAPLKAMLGILRRIDRPPQG